MGSPAASRKLSSVAIVVVLVELVGELLVFLGEYVDLGLQGGDLHGAVGDHFAEFADHGRVEVLVVHQTCSFPLSEWVSDSMNRSVALTMSSACAARRLLSSVDSTPSGRAMVVGVSVSSADAAEIPKV